MNSNDYRPLGQSRKEYLEMMDPGEEHMKVYEKPGLYNHLGPKGEVIDGPRNVKVGDCFKPGLRECVTGEAFTKHDSTKLRYSLLPPEALQDVVRVLEHGAAKYADENWKKCDEPVRYWNAAMRHMQAIQMGEDADTDTRLPHAAHAACCLLFYLALTEDY